MPAIHKLKAEISPEISPFEYTRLGSYTSLRPAYESIWCAQVKARKSGRRWWIDRESAISRLQALGRIPQTSEPVMSATSAVEESP